MPEACQQTGQPLLEQAFEGIFHLIAFFAQFLLKLLIDFVFGLLSGFVHFFLCFLLGAVYFFVGLGASNVGGDVFESIAEAGTIKGAQAGWVFGKVPAAFYWNIRALAVLRATATLSPTDLASNTQAPLVVHCAFCQIYGPLAFQAHARPGGDQIGTVQGVAVNLQAATHVVERGSRAP